MTERDRPGKPNPEPTSAPQARAGRAVPSERRIVTTLFCDVVGSTTLAGRLDPEDWTEIMNGAFERITPAVQRYGGTVARLLGDAALAIFGAPVAHEDDPQRSVLAALEIFEALKPLQAQVRLQHKLDFDVRMGINTGEVIVGDVGATGSREYTAMGDAVNVAARMEQTAQPGTVQVSHETYRLVAPLFDVEPLGPVEVKGKSEPVVAYRVLRAKAQPGHLRGIDGVSAPLIGRDAELARLKEALDRLRQGRGQIVSIIGEAGLGKSRLLEELRKAWGDDVRSYWAAQGVAYDSARPYGLFQHFARERFGVELDDPGPVIHQKVTAVLQSKLVPPEQIALCTVAMEQVIAAKVLYDAPDLPADAIKQDLREQFYRAWHGAGEQGGTVLVLDDFHWADSASVELLTHMLQLTEEVPILFVLAFRPERQSPAWQLKLKAETDYPHRYTEIMLQPLDEQHTDELVSALLNIADLPAELRRLIMRKTDGNPYFVEEIVRTLIEQSVVYRTQDGLRWKAATKVEDIALPDNLQALLMARIDRLDRETKETLQVASVIGRTFYLRILKAISDSAMAVDRQLTTLERVELVREEARVPELEYIFKHELARDAAYHTILNRRRREFHRRVGNAMETLFPDKLEEHAHRLAQHFAMAGDDQRALKYYVMAGEAAAGLFANTEASAQYARAIEAAERSGIPAEEMAHLRARSAALAVLA